MSSPDPTRAAAAAAAAAAGAVALRSPAAAASNGDDGGNEANGRVVGVVAGANPRPPPPKHYGTVFTNAKAGMDGVDFEHVKRVVYEASVNSLHGKHQEKRDAALERRVDALRARAASLVKNEPGTVAAAERKADSLASELLSSRDRGRSWVCVDMDCFFFSVEARDDPERLLADPPRPFAVGSTSMITTANGEARRYGVRSAMPGFVALRLCPQLQFVKPRFEAYVAASKEVMSVLAEYDPRFERMGLDEAFVDVTDFVSRKRESGSPSFTALDAAGEIRRSVRRATRLPSSAGVAPNKMLAKIASDLGKPDGAFAVPRDPAEIASFVGSLPVRKVPGVGRVTERILDGALDVKTCAQLFAKRGLVFCLFGKATAEFLLSASLGVGSDEHGRGDDEGDHQRKGLSAERTFAPTPDVGFLESKISEIAARVSEGAASEGLKPRTLTLKIKFATFDVVTRSISVGGGGHGAETAASAASLCSGLSSFSDAETVAAVAVALFRGECEKHRRCEPVRLLGIRLSNWVNESAPLEKGQKRLDDVLAAFSSKGGGGGGGGDNDGDGNDDGAAPPLPRAAAAPPPPPPPSSSSTWTCQLCTYSETRHFSLRCDVCCAPRGTKSDGDGGGLLAERAIADQRAVAEGRGAGKGAGTARRKEKRSAAGAPLDAFFLKKR